MPILTSKEIVGMFRYKSPLSNEKLLFVSIAGNSGWITEILNGNKGKNKLITNIQKTGLNEETDNKDNSPGDNETNDDK